jgi:hypothetical protein
MVCIADVSDELNVSETNMPAACIQPKPEASMKSPEANTADFLLRFGIQFLQK